MNTPYAELLRPIPNPYTSYEAWHALNCDDLTVMCRGDLLADLTACRMRTAYEGRAVHWWIPVRIAALENALGALQDRPAADQSPVEHTVTAPSVLPHNPRPAMRAVEFRGGRVVAR